MERAETDGLNLAPYVAAWLTRQMIADASARLVDAGAGADRRIMLTEVFVDLPLVGERQPNNLALATLLGAAVQDDPRRDRWLLVGSAGSGKSTLSTMFAQVLRQRWVEATLDRLNEADVEEARTICAAVATVTQEVLKKPPPPWVPLRIDLPTLSSWVANEGEEDALAGTVPAAPPRRGEIRRVLPGVRVPIPPELPVA